MKASFDFVKEDPLPKNRNQSSVLLKVNRRNRKVIAGGWA